MKKWQIYSIVIILMLVYIMLFIKYSNTPVSDLPLWVWWFFR